MAERTLQVRVSREVSSTSMYKPAPAYCPPNPTSPAAPPFVSSLYPPAYQQADYTFPCYATTTGSVTVSEAAEKPPEYQKLQSKCRAERCFSYGFLFIPIWLWGFLHFWLPFAQRMPAPFQITPRPTLPVCIPTDAILPHPGMPKSTIGPAGRFDSIRQPGISFAPVVDDSWQLHASCTDLEGSQPDMDARWRREEKKWALRCGYALAVWWSAMLVFAVVLVQSGVLRR